MRLERAVVLDAATGEAERIQMEAVLVSLTRLGLVSVWDRLPDGRYRIEADPHVVMQLVLLGWPQDQHAAAVGAWGTQ